MLLLLPLFLAACSANNLDPAAQSVRVTNSDPKGNCTFLGTVTGDQGNFFTGDWTSNANLETGALNTLRNKTASLGGIRFHLLLTEPEIPVSSMGPAAAVKKLMW